MRRRTQTAGAQPSTDARRGIPAMPSACASATGSRKRSARSRPLGGRTRRSSVAATGLMGLHLRGRRLQSGAAAKAPGGSSRRTCGSGTISIWPHPPMTIGADNYGEIASASCKPVSISATARRWYSSHGPGSTKWMRSQATVTRTCSTTALSRSHLPFTMRGHSQCQTRDFFNGLLGLSLGQRAKPSSQRSLSSGQ